MPELPEVEVVRRGLETHLVGRGLERVEVLHARPVRRHLAGADDFVARLSGRRVLGARRRGKYLWLPLDSGDAVLGHLGMSGQLLVQRPAAPDERHLRVRFTLTDGNELRFVDQRMFGSLAVSTDGADLPPEIAHIARDPLDPLFDDDAFVRAVRRRRSEVKRILLDQGVVSGVGNIYADEALWRAQVHGERLGEKLRAVDVRRVLGEARAVMEAALLEGGTSFDALYVNVNGESGYFDRSLHAYGQEGRPCERCGTADRAGVVHEPLVVLLPAVPAASPPAALSRTSSTAAGTVPVQSAGVHGSEGTHSLPQAAHANSGSSAEALAGVASRCTPSGSRRSRDRGAVACRARYRGAGIDRAQRAWDSGSARPPPAASSRSPGRVTTAISIAHPFGGHHMAKALLGYMSSTDPRVVAQLTAENRRLTQQVADLEAHVLRLQAENDTLAAALRDAPILTLDESMQPV